MASLDDRRREMRARADQGDAYARGFLDGIQEREDWSRQRSKVGRRSGVPDDIRELIGLMADADYSLGQVATWLTENGIPTSQNGKAWRPSSVAVILKAR